MSATPFRYVQGHATAVASGSIGLLVGIHPDDPLVDLLLDALDGPTPLDDVFAALFARYEALPVLAEAGKVDTAYGLLLQDTFPSWLFSVKHGATTIWERWDGWTPEKGFQDPGMNSFNHYALGSCGEWLFEGVAGIVPDPEAPGFKRFTVRPRPGPGLTEARARFDSIHGSIASEWKLKDGRLDLTVVVPANTTATVRLPAKDPSAVTESGKPAASAEGVKALPPGEGEAVFEVGAGEYRFGCAAP